MMRSPLASLVVAAIGCCSIPLWAETRNADSQSPATAPLIAPIPGARDSSECMPLRAESARQLQQAVLARLKESRSAARVLSYCARHERGDDEADIATVPTVKDRWLSYVSLSCAAPLAQSSWSCGRLSTVNYVLTRRLQWVQTIDVGEAQAIAIVDMLDAGHVSVPACLSESGSKRELGARKDLTVRRISHLASDAATTARVQEGDDTNVLVHFKTGDSSGAGSLPTLDCYSIAANDGQ
jgi:hypothetical protein